MSAERLTAAQICNDPDLAGCSTKAMRPIDAELTRLYDRSDRLAVVEAELAETRRRLEMTDALKTLRMAVIEYDIGDWSAPMVVSAARSVLAKADRAGKDGGHG